ncbi:MAG TPA: S46 family peptidase [Bryobacteraceae bacterium]|nr:S46 family peptidase [Bryobacteraceae bacterium]
MRNFALMRLGAFSLFCLIRPLSADEGTWLVNQFPAEAVKQKYNFDANLAFLGHLQAAAVRIAGGSGAFVSADGLILTNQHLVSGCLGKLGDRQHDYLKDGFYAPARAAELPCSGLEASVLEAVEDVTAQVKAAANDKTPAAQALQQRNAASARIEQQCAEKTHRRCSVVKLYSGGRYDLYQYKTYSDIRLVFAPENDLAFFGRTRDSLTYLRYGLDIAFLRAYENGRPAATPGFLKWSREGVKEGDLIFSFGNPAPTMRLATSAQLTFYRDTELPFTVSRLQARIRSLGEFASQNQSNLEAAEPVLNAILARYKTSAGMLIGLRDDRLVTRKTVFEGKIRRAVLGDSKLGADANKVWDEVAAAYKSWTPFEKAYQLLEKDPAPGSTLFAVARQLVRSASPASPPPAAPPVNQAIETLLLSQYLEELKNLSGENVPIKMILDGKTPKEAAEAMAKSSRLAAAAQSGASAAPSDDPIVRLAKLLDEPARRLQKKHDELIGSLETSAAEKIAQYRFKLFGAADYPDATGSPRVMFGVVKSYVDRAGVAMPAASTFGGLYFRHGNEGPYQVPPRWVELKSSLNLNKPLDFVSTCDIGGGDPGSPAVNAAGELVGITFDGNLESLPDAYLYSDEQARAVHVSVDGVAEALQKIYQAQALLKELGF